MRLLTHLPEPGPNVEAQEIESKIKQVHRRVKNRFNMFHVWDPHPFKDKPPEKLGRLNAIFFDSIRIMRNMAPTTCDLQPIARGYSTGDPEESQQLEDTRFLSCCTSGIDLYMIADARHSTSRLRHDFERILSSLERLKRSGAIARLPEKPRPRVWRTCLEVWDMRKSGMSNLAIAKQLFPVQYRTNPKNAETLASQHYAMARQWISLNWARSRVNATGAPKT